ncbi:MAG: DegT/DnrJ/EryC1/StrS family aminotransferase [Patescibacteria group bacterium]|nr:DegT/DnrJ/EryC1/StrS family aminotransferase [Patescibacteria group bacterium]MDD5164191.1 DegT/DnrJ/EryC1/StrS family aminotransferase [Patescibacteria group bacterium]MDD5534475.1 DegT/DnrJ/EryC1/StrS family aminotransferase [Patescibacteria group bacterium]
MYKVRFANPQKQYQDHRKEFIQTFDDVLSRGDIVMRKDLEKFEKDFAEFVGTKYAIGVNSGTSAVYLGLKAAGIKKNDEVITVAHTFIASLSCVYLTGAKPVLIDVGNDFNMNPKLIEKALTPKTKAIEPVHLNGRLCDMEVIMDIAKRKGLMVIEDAAQALGATLKMSDGTNKKAGSFGTAGCFSLYWAKTLGGWGNNGMLVTNDSKIAEAVKLMRYNGEDRRKRHFYYHSHNLLMDNLHAALLNVKFKYFPTWLKRRKEIAKKYQQGLANIPQIKLPHFDDNRFSDIYTNYVIRAERRDELKKYLEKQSIETLISWPSPTYKEPVFASSKFNQEFGMPKLVSTKGIAVELPETKKICHEVISLPMYPELTNTQIDWVVENIKKFYQK